MFSGRNILVEHLERGAKAKRARVSAPHQPGAPPNEAQVLAATVSLVEAAEYTETDAIIYVEVKDELPDAILDESIDRHIVMLSLCQGAFFKPGVCWHLKPVWKSMKIPDGHDKHLLWFAHADGWFCSDTLFEAPFDFDEVRTDIKISLHADLQEGVNMPKIVHFPYWEKTQCSLITAEGLWQYVERKNSAGAAASSSADVSESAFASLSSKAIDLETEDAEKDVGKGYTGKADMQPKRAGWMPKVATLVAAVYNKDWEYVEKLARRYYGESKMLARLVDAKIRH